MNRNLFLVILAMDSYNRGYGVGIKGLGGVGSGIGDATIFRSQIRLRARWAFPPVSTPSPMT